MVLDYTDNIRVTLQTTNLCATYAQETSWLVVDTIIRMRNEQDAATFYKIVKIRADLEKPSLPRKQKVPNIVNFLYGYRESVSHHYENGNNFYRAQYFAAINNETETIKNRFDQPVYQMYVYIEQTVWKGTVGLDVDQHINMLQTIYKDESKITITYSILKSKIEITVQYTTNKEGIH